MNYINPLDLFAESVECPDFFIYATDYELANFQDEVMG